MTIRGKMTLRERRLVSAAKEGLYYLKQLQDENAFGEHLGGEQGAIKELEKALKPYKVLRPTPMLTPEEALALKWETP